ncbi:MAG TPA: adenylyl-sulfate kinase [Candidatus Paceibacterota bacterium]|nr:adenylyl-sulfate kinase [Candidatus Paceibacterota bacterium]
MNDWSIRFQPHTLAKQRQHFTMTTITKVIWLFGRSGAGKTTLARCLRTGFQDRNIPVFYLDGDEMRSGLCSDLGFTGDARLENHRRIAEVARLAAEQGFNVVVSTMAPQHSQRDIVKQIVASRLMWIYVHAPLNVCIERDPKGLYKRAKAGSVTGLLDYPFEVPRPDERENFIDTVAQNTEGCYQTLLEIVLNNLSEFAI